MGETIAITPVALRDAENEVAQALRAGGYQVRVHPLKVPPSPVEHRALLAEAAGVILGPEPFGRERMLEAPKLRVISRYGVGYDNIDLDAATDLGIVATYVPDAMVEAVADITLGLLLAAARRIAEFDRRMKEGDWPRELAADVSGQTLGILGTGRIGLAVARRARAFNMRLLGYDPYPNPVFNGELGGEYVSMETLLETSDFVSLHLPAMAKTRGLIDAAKLARMKPTAYLLNCARGSIVDEPALLEALDSGRLAGAGLDVFSKEPPDAGSAAAALCRHMKVVGTPHVASYTPVTVAKMGVAALENLLTVLRGERPQFVCNPEVYARGLRQ